MSKKKAVALIKTYYNLLGCTDKIIKCHFGHFVRFLHLTNRILINAKIETLVCIDPSDKMRFII